MADIRTATWTRRPVPAKYDDAYFRVELQNAERAIPPYVVRKVTDDSSSQRPTDRVVLFDIAGAESYTLLDPLQAPVFAVWVKNDAASGGNLTIIGTVDGAADPVLAPGEARLVQPDPDGSQFVILSGY